MALSSSKSNYHVRSASLPSRSHPTTLSVQEELKKLQTWESSCSPTAENICGGLSGLEQVYRSVNDLLILSSTQQAFCRHQNKKWTENLLDGSVRLLDVCSRIRDLISQLKENVGQLQSSIRRRKGEQSVDSIICKYTLFTKRAKKEAKKLLADLKQSDNQFGGLQILDLDQDLLPMIRVLREVSSLSISIFQSVLTFLVTPVLKTKPSERWSLVSKVMQKRTDKVENTNDLEAFGASLEGIDSSVELIFRRLIATRGSLLNMISC